LAPTTLLLLELARPHSRAITSLSLCVRVGLPERSRLRRRRLRRGRVRLAPFPAVRRMPC